MSNTLSHTKWNCKYHILFIPKYRRKIFYVQKRMEIGKILRDISDWQEVKIIEAEVCPDHVHMFVEIPPKFLVPWILCRHGRQKCKMNSRICEKSITRRYDV